ncbi:restriction endonuclease [Helicobacter bizzozeronii]|uniref:restriction endonuclease n=1 Tax=Helicobacter bizzozeronii TaxID=56877 RepID=UPI000CEDEBEA|nr:restriction endonuclease [Helicobacter bizzozeronii]
MLTYLNNIIAYLKQKPVILNASNRDGRINSISHEDQILAVLTDKFSEVQMSPPRCWYDFKIVKDSQGIFVNIKVSDLNNNSADNISAKLGMGYALTGVQNLPTPWEKFHAILAEQLKLGYDYYFLVVNKNDPKDCFWTSLKRIETLNSTGNNLPFQCKWNKNRGFSKRNEIEATRYILNVYWESWKKRVEGYPSHEISSSIDQKICNWSLNGANT